MFFVDGAPVASVVGSDKEGIENQIKQFELQFSDNLSGPYKHAQTFSNIPKSQNVDKKHLSLQI